MKKKICMLTLALALSATTLIGCSSKEEAGEYNTIITEESGDLDVIPEDTTADDADAADDTTADDAADDTTNTEE